MRQTASLLAPNLSQIIDNQLVKQNEDRLIFWLFQSHTQWAPYGG